MFKYIEIVKGPIHNGKKFEFSEGTTAIIGANGCGKSLLVEYLAFALFGSCALRSKVSDYKGLQVNAEVIIKGISYRIERSVNGCRIISNGKEICSGTKPCNQKIIILLGYDYNVYKMGNYAAQLDILGLGKLKPSERKTAIDKTLGIGIMDKLIKYCTDTALKYEHERDALSSVKKPTPVAPVKPEGYCDLNIISGDYALVDKEIKDYESFIKMPRPIEPEMPLFSPYAMRDLESMQEVLLKRRLLEAELQKSPESLPVPPMLSLAELDNIDKAKLDWQEYNIKMELFKKSEVSCPECGHRFSFNMIEPTKPNGDPAILNFNTREMRTQWANYQKMENLRLKSEVQKELDSLENITQAEINEKIAYDKAMVAYEKDLTYFQETEAEWKKKALEFKDFKYDDKKRELNELSTLYYACKNYDTEIKVYEKSLLESMELQSKIDEKDSQSKKYRQGADNLKEMKNKIKGYVLPSLQRVSSTLLEEMSDGLYSNVTIDGEFNVLVEDREIALYSGSEQAMINLALRLGLGQVLTHKAFSVFIGDEIDASMRDERAQLTADCLRRISKHIHQVLLVSHRDIEADNYINLGDK